jgi:hypothetical protein
MIDIKKIITKDNMAKFLYYRHGHLYYSIDTDGMTYIFPVDLGSVGDATFNKTEKSVMMMKYVRAAIDVQELQCIKTISSL